MKVILGSSSPRRKELLKTLFDEFVIVSPSFDESSILKTDPNYASKESLGKLKSILNPSYFDCLMITCDTIVRLNNKIYGKPSSLDEAKIFLNELSNNTHEVISGYSIFYKGKIITKEITSFVTFNKLDDKTIENYINNEYILDKAGAYAIQDDAKFHLINKIKGSLNNIIGFPIEDIKLDIDYLLNNE